ncbi:hypothetical protein T484DRAFT_1805194 [Baffinella frigidus]|nr:hypothetical protein T484DRAFT_1805194 [Cryptophyta sp. CCMP2293]
MPACVALSITPLQGCNVRPTVDLASKTLSVECAGLEALEIPLDIHLSASGLLSFQIRAGARHSCYTK